MQNITLITAIAGLVFGFLGAVLGVVNTWRAINRDRVRLRVRPVWTIFQQGDPCLSIEVTNIGYVAVTVTEVGITLRDRSKKFTILPTISGGGHLPQRLEPRTAITAITRPGTENTPALKDGRRAFAMTACGCRFTGSSPALRGVIDKARSAGS